VTCLSRHTMNHATRTVQYSPIALLGSSGDAHTLCLYRQVIDNAEDGCRLAWAVCANGFRLEWQVGLPEGYCAIAHPYEIFFLWCPTLTDPRDEMLLELAVKARCQYIVIYNTRYFRGADQFGIAIVTPKALLEAIGVLP
jgi:hypothetical protein